MFNSWFLTQSSPTRLPHADPAPPNACPPDPNTPDSSDTHMKLTTTDAYAHLWMLQADIVTLHVPMEGIGVGEPLATWGECMRKHSMIGTCPEEDTAHSEGGEAAEEQCHKEQGQEFEL